MVQKDKGRGNDPHGERIGWIMDRIAQEYGILSWAGPVEDLRQLEIGEKIQLWPNHCCIAAAGFGYFLVIDRSKEGWEQDTIADVWPRRRGW